MEPESMMQLLEFTFQTFWHFVGVMILLGMVCKAVMVCVLAIAASIEGIGR